MNEEKQADRSATSARKLDAYRAEVTQHHRVCLKTERAWSWARLAWFFSGVAVWVFVPNPYAALSITGFVVAMFAFSVRGHLRARGERAFADRLLQMIVESQRRLGGHLVTIRSSRRPEDTADGRSKLPQILNPGVAWSLSDQERDDLDLYAEPIGVFGLLNRTSTWMGARRLRDLCERPCLSPDRISSRQACVRWLDDNMESRSRIMADAAILRDRNARLEAFLDAVQSASPLPSPSHVRLLRAWSLPSSAFMVYALVQTATAEPGWLGALITVVLFNAVVFQRMHSRINEHVSPWRDVAHAVRGLLTACRRAEHELPDTTELQVLRSRFTEAIAPDVLPALKWRLDLTNTGGTVHAILNVTMFYDLHTAAAILGRIIPHRQIILDAIAGTAELETLTSLACFAFEQPVATYPSFPPGRVLHIEAGLHPLIPPEKIIGNDLHLSADARVRVITGSNMAGKSTYLRMIGVNTLLAQLGGAVTADRMRLTPVRLVTDLRIRDDLSKDESYFLAEVRQIKRMLIPPDSDAPLLGLIDEPFRGTNSVERIAASAAVVQHLIDSDHFFIVATHEQKLTQLADGTVAANYHFHEDLGEGGSIFEHALRPGPAQMRNAIRILDREGFPKSILDNARRWLTSSDDSP